MEVKKHTVIPSGSAWGPRIANWTLREFPSKATKGDDLFEAVFEEIVGTKQTRYGPRPSPESQVAIREVVKNRIAAGKPVPFMVPWGSEKPNGSGVDVAELGALRVMSCLDARIAAHYAPGAEFNLRVEDLSAPYQFHERPDEARRQATRYTSGLQGLNYVLGTNDIVSVDLESAHGISEEQYGQQADLAFPAVLAHLKDANNFEPLLSLGWDRPIEQATIAHYMQSYDRLYPLASHKERLVNLARYFASALTRKKLRLNGVKAEWGKDYLELAFHKLPPGVRERSKRLQYRTLPLEMTSNVIAPWRAHGYLEIDDRGDVTPKLASFHEHLALETDYVDIQRGNVVVRVQTDFTVV